MSFLARCDACSRRALCSFVDGQWVPPSRWHTFPLEDWEAHGCSQACFETLKTTTTSDATPTSSDRIMIP